MLSDDWYVLKKTTFEFLRRDNVWQRQSRETYDRGNGATILLFDPARETVVLTRQFRLPAFVNGHDGMLIETPAGLLDEASPEERIRAELEEETGYRVRDVEKVFEAFMSPGSVTEKLYFFVAHYDSASRVAAGRRGRVGGRGHRSDRTAARAGAGDGRARRDRRRQDHHAASASRVAPRQTLRRARR